jgi:propionyl-CoA carboxylase beta chain
MSRVVLAVLDPGSFLETQARFARNIVTGFGHLGGRVVGVVANQPAVLAGVLDINDWAAPGFASACSRSAR